ncbi:sugar ABC transporter substrate-binding protein [Oscillospiraceae bacterium MB08-C2-2]|nr:sugar ABC transporter substrate-binding protein [Oscillospiraceae bacterium MB08-C2-2]
MKKLMALVVVMILALSTACGGGAAPTPSSAAPSAAAPASSGAPTEQAKEQLVFGYSPPTMNNPFFLWIEQNVRAVVEGKGDKLITVDPQLDPQKQISQVEDLLQQDIDILLLCPFDSASIKNALVAAEGKGVPVIIFDTPVLDPQYVKTTVASDNYNAGVVVAKDMMSKLPEGSKVAILASPLAQTDRLRVGGFRDTVGEFFDIVTELDGKGDTGVSMPLAEDILQGNPDLSAFFCGNDPSAIGAVQAIESAGKTGKLLVYGVDGAPEAKAAIKEGKMEGSGAQSPTNIAKLAVDAAYRYLDGETLDENTVVETFIINKENIDDYVIDGWQ